MDLSKIKQPQLEDLLILCKIPVPHFDLEIKSINFDMISIGKGKVPSSDNLAHLIPTDPTLDRTVYGNHTIAEGRAVLSYSVKCTEDKKTTLLEYYVTNLKPLLPFDSSTNLFDLTKYASVLYNLTSKNNSLGKSCSALAQLQLLEIFESISKDETLLHDVTSIPNAKKSLMDALGINRVNGYNLHSIKLWMPIAQFYRPDIISDILDKNQTEFKATASRVILDYVGPHPILIKSKVEGLQ